MIWNFIKGGLLVAVFFTVCYTLIVSLVFRKELVAAWREWARKPKKPQFFYGDTLVFRLDDVRLVDYSKLLDDRYLTVHVFHNDALVTDTVSGFGAEELMYFLRPSALEGKRYKWKKHAWSIHNLIGHPVMQILAWMRLHRAAMWVHDVTTPLTTVRFKSIFTKEQRDAAARIIEQTYDGRGTQYVQGSNPEWDRRDLVVRPKGHPSLDS